MQIGVGLSLPLLATRRSGGFSPRSLFTSGVAGAWYDPSDYNTLFQDSAGTTPVTAVEQPVGLMLDKSQGLVLGSEKVTNGTFDTNVAGWSVGPLSGTPSWSAGEMLVTVNVANGRAQTTLSGMVVGATYRLTVTMRIVTPSGTSKAWIGASATGLGVSQFLETTSTSNVTLTRTIIADATTMLLVAGDNSGTSGAVFAYDNITLQQIPGNHASQATAASRPVLRARYNLLTYSEQFDNAAWNSTGGNITVTANSTTAPDLTTTADTATPSTLSAQHRLYNALAPFPANAASVYFKANGYSKVALKDWFSGVYASFDLSAVSVLDKSASVTAGITSEGNGWYRCRMTTTQTSTSGIQLSILAPGYTSGDPNGSTFAGDGTSGVFVWGAQYTLRSDSSAGTYQRIAAATDYATAGFLPYLYFVTDDSFGTNSIDFTATDKMSVCAGVTKLSDASAQIVCELSATSSAGNNGSFAIISALSPSNYAFYLYGNALASRTATTYASPVTNVVSVKYDISQSTVPNEIAPQINGAVPTLADAGGAGTGNFGNYPLYIGRRNNASLPFNGNLYQLIVCGKALSASELASTEAYVATKTGVTL